MDYGDEIGATGVVLLIAGILLGFAVYWIASRVLRNEEELTSSSAAAQRLVFQRTLGWFLASLTTSLVGIALLVFSVTVPL